MHTAALNAAQRRTSSASESSQTGSPISRPVFTASAIPFRSSSSGSVSSVPGSITTRAGQWNAPIRFLPPGRSTAVLPPIAASTWPTSVVGTATHGTPRMYVAAANPARSVVQPPPSPTTVPSRPIRSARQSRSRTAIALAASPGGTSCSAMSRSPSASWAVTPWMPATFASETISTAPCRARAPRAGRSRRSAHRSRQRRERPRPCRAPGRGRPRPPRRRAAASR